MNSKGQARALLHRFVAHHALWHAVPNRVIGFEFDKVFPNRHRINETETIDAALNPLGNTLFELS